MKRKDGRVVKVRHLPVARPKTFRSCPKMGKVMYATRDQARRVLTHMREQYGSDTGLFLCKYCKEFHLGRVVRARLTDKRRRRARAENGTD